jgi:N-acetylglucosaminyl-diphospho-decaprenol L-rhamnosyltransferase
MSPASAIHHRDTENSINIIIVTHESHAVLERCLQSLNAQSLSPSRIIIIDSGSSERGYLERYENNHLHLVRRYDNIGYGAANNCGIHYLSADAGYVVFLNPDVFLEPACLAIGKSLLEENSRIGACSGLLMGYDITSDRETGRIDSAGIYRTWYGRWYDRGQGSKEVNRYGESADAPALCGAFLFCRINAVRSYFPTVFDESFFMYKEDIDLSLRLRRNGWRLRYEPTMRGLHCRGWDPDRRQVGRAWRLLAARNELLLTGKHRSPYVIYALFKYLVVKLGDQ